MKVSVLSSGSTGNSTLIETEQHKILMDAGLSGKKTKDLLAQVGVDIKDIDMIFISHDHTDHSGGLGVLMRRYPQISGSLLFRLPSACTRLHPPAPGQRPFRSPGAECPAHCPP